MEAEAKIARLDALEKSYRDCENCPLHKERTKLVTWRGNVMAKLAIIGDAPSEEDDAVGRPFVGAIGGMLWRALKANDLTHEDVFMANLVACRTPRARRPDVEEIKACGARFKTMIGIVRPRVVLMLGSTLHAALWGEAAMDVRVAHDVTCRVLHWKHPRYGMDMSGLAYKIRLAWRAAHDQEAEAEA